MVSGGYAAFRAKQALETDLSVDPVGMLTEALEQNQADRSESSIRFKQWSLRVPEPKTGTLDFGRFPFQEELYDEAIADTALMVKKATQVGISTWLMRWAMYWADIHGRTVIYLFPKAKQLYDFSDARIKPLVQTEYLRTRVPPLSVQNKGLKQFGHNGFIYFRGSEAVEGLDSVDADRLCLDEYDTLSAENLPHVEKRLDGSLDPMTRYVGVPSTPEWGIDELWLDSDMRRWHMKCGACGEWQHVTFDDNLVWAGSAHARKKVDAPYIGCRKCLRPLNVLKGEWVAEWPERSMRGYHMPRLIVAHTDLTKVIKESKRKSNFQVRIFHNKVLAEPFVEEEGRLSRQALAAAEQPFAMVPGNDGGLVTMGVDVASARNLNVRISLFNEDDTSGKVTKGALWIGEVGNFDELDSLMRRYDVKMCCIDSMPEHRLSNSFAERNPGKVYLVRYTGGQAIKVFDIDEELRVITVRRTEAIDATFSMIRDQRNHLPLDRPDDYDSQMMSLVRFAERDELGKEVIGYRSSRPFDYAMAEVYDLIAFEAWRVRTHLDTLQGEEFSALEDHMEFQRSAIHEEFADEYHAGYGEGEGEDEYSPGYEPDE